MEIDFSLTNPNIKKYFEGDNTYIPTGELLYLHTHPLITPNFISEINDIVVRAGNKLIYKNIPANSRLVLDLQDLCIQLGKRTSEESAKEMLSVLRNIFILCNKINKL